MRLVPTEPVEASALLARHATIISNHHLHSSPEIITDSLAPEIGSVKLAFLTQNRPEFLARIPKDLPHVIAWADQPGDTYSAAMLEKLKDVDAMLVSAEQVHAQLLEACPNVKIVQRIGVGYDTLDLAAGKQRGIPMCNVAGVNKEAVAEFHIAMILALIGLSTLKLR